ncbi:MAG: SUMF1/EgtB/PvdO family nonheme iron enzyme [Steroidobacteraceae bacterium]|nr:SUMF1/EgtB/PvdO family nonheme iron enzyme [Steroidobacteraceae bacterium]
MTDWLRILKRCREGAISRDELFAAAASLIDEGADAKALAETLQSEHARAPLPLSGIDTVRIRILGAADRTMVQPPHDAEKTAILPPHSPVNEATQLIDGASGPVSHRTAVDVNTVLLHRFKLVQLVGEGGMSDVYKAIDLRKVEAGARDPYLAVKVLTVRFDDYFSSLAVMHQEASKLQTLTHPNIVRVIDWDRDGQTVFMTMEYLDGTPLKVHLKRDGTAPALPREQAFSLIAQMVAALEFAHDKHIVHGDLKPGNVIITTTGVAKIIDFGIARFLRRPHEDDPNDPEDWRGSFSALTPHYASPEMHDGADPDPRDDVFALACIAHELLTGVHPFNRASSTKARETGMQLVPSKHLRAHEAKALQNALAFQREKRTPRAGQFLDELTGARQKSQRRGALLGSLAFVAVAALAFLIVKLFTRGPIVGPTAPLEAGDVFRDCATCPLMVALAAGSYTQGSAAGEPDAQPFEQPAHAVTIAEPFAAGVHEITVGEFAEFARDNTRNSEGCAAYDGEWKLQASTNWRNATPEQQSTHPVSCVSWKDANDYAAWLSQRTGFTYRLPSAAEWEYFARAGSATLPWPDADAACENANVADQSGAQRYPGWTAFACKDGFVHAAPVGSFTANAFGLTDTLGNVFEWTQDCWREHYAQLDGDCTQHETRGGSWFTAPSFVRPAYRNRFESGYQANSIGFRLVREIRNAR